MSNGRPYRAPGTTAWFTRGVPDRRAALDGPRLRARTSQAAGLPDASSKAALTSASA
jgi:hypothetical protein